MTISEPFVCAGEAPPGPEHALTMQDIRSDPLAFIMDNTRRYGDIVRYRVDDWQTTLVNHPAYIKHVLQDNHRNYTKEGTPDFMMLKPMLGEGILTSEGASWLRQRRMAQPAFQRRRIEAYGSLMTNSTSTMLDEWETASRSGHPLEMVEQMTHLTLRIVAQALFGYEVGSTADRFGWAVQVLNECIGHYDPTDELMTRDFPRAIAIIREIVHRMIFVRRLTGRDEGDFLSMLLWARDEESNHQMSDQQVRDQVLTLLLAGHETTAKALGWIFYLLGQHPEVETRLIAELQQVLAGRLPTVEDAHALPYTWMVVSEALRLYPPIWIVSRVCLENDIVGGYRIPAGSLVTISPYAMHRHPQFWSDPEQFDPERFRSELEATRPAFAYLPFSGGPRLCLGKHFASLETHLVLATILQRYRLRLVAGHPVEPEALVTLRPRHGLPMTIHPLQPLANGVSGG